ncbi:MAG: glucose 1-dehydrogenase [Chloroflexi bacterium]|nr:glucose 1-dehydrogenase [Chloroflexota bacterium]MDA1147940.1 glucose 1-dehydrogenase [Chloroflexota bacterium]
MAGRLEGNTALITGGARGQGAAEARLFAAEGANIVVTDILDDDGQQTAAAVGGTYIHHDVTSEADWAAVVKQAVEQYGGIDVLVNNAGIWMQTHLLGGSLDDYRRVIEVNQIGVFLGMRDVAPAMIERGGGSIVNISSIAGLRGTAGSIAYGASKWAVRGMTKSAARELAPHNVRVNSIHPGLIDTAMLQQLPGIDSGNTDTYINRVPLGRFAAADEVAKLALYLASDDSSYSTGSEFIVDGGMTA